MREMERKKINKEKRTTLPPPTFFFSYRKRHYRQWGAKNLYLRRPNIKLDN